MRDSAAPARRARRGTAGVVLPAAHSAPPHSCCRVRAAPVRQRSVAQRTASGCGGRGRARTATDRTTCTFAYKQRNRVYKLGGQPKEGMRVARGGYRYTVHSWLIVGYALVTRTRRGASVTAISVQALDARRVSSRGGRMGVADRADRAGDGPPPFRSPSGALTKPAKSMHFPLDFH